MVLGRAGMLGLVGAGFYKGLRPRGDDDFVDRLNYYYTPLMLGFAAVLVSAKQYVGKPIQCWVPQQFSTSMEDYIENYCWVQNTYWLPMYTNIPDDHERRDEMQIGYYQWVPFILAAEALLFALPGLLWRLCSPQSGLNLHSLVSTATEVQCAGAEAQAAAVEAIAHSLHSLFSLHSASATDRRASLAASSVASRRISSALIRLHRHNGAFVTLLYLFVKLLFGLNAVAQFFLLNAFLKTSAYSFYGVQVLGDLLRGRDWGESGHFPRVTLCDFEVRYLGNTNRYTVQCALMVNLFNEKVFAMIWCWMLVLVSLTLASFFVWASSCTGGQRLSFVLSFLRVSALQAGSPPSFAAPSFLYDAFVEDFLRADGVLVLRLIASHAGDVLAAQVATRLWLLFRCPPPVPEALRPPDSPDKNNGWTSTQAASSSSSSPAKGSEASSPVRGAAKAAVLEEARSSDDPRPMALFHVNQSITC